MVCKQHARDFPSHPAISREILTFLALVYGYSFYLQWFSTLILLIFAPAEAHSSRKSGIILSTAIISSSFRTMTEGALIIVDWHFICWMICVSSMFNIPFKWKEWEHCGVDLAWLLGLFAALCFASPWVFFNGIYNGRKEGCDIRFSAGISTSIYSRSSIITYRVGTTILGILGGSAYLLLSLFVFASWYLRKRGLAEPCHVQYHPGYPFYKILSQFVAGVVSIPLIESSLVVSKITFPDTSIMDTGQLIPLIIGIATTITSITTAFGNIVRSVCSKMLLANITDFVSKVSKKNETEPIELSGEP